MAQVEHVRDWLKQLGALIAPSMTGEEFHGRINVLAPELAAEFPPDAYNPESCRHVARQCRFFPNYAEACQHLSAWWRQHRFIPLLAPEPSRESPAPRSEAELQHVSLATRRVVAELLATVHEREAQHAKRLPVYQAQRGQMTRAELNEAYRAAGIQGPRVPEPAQIIPLRRP